MKKKEKNMNAASSHFGILWTQTKRYDLFMKNDKSHVM